MLYLTKILDICIKKKKLQKFYYLVFIFTGKIKDRYNLFWQIKPKQMVKCPKCPLWSSTCCPHPFSAKTVYLYLPRRTLATTNANFTQLSLSLSLRREESKENQNCLIRKRSGGPAHSLALPLTPFIIYFKTQSVTECVHIRSPINTTSQQNFTLTKIERETEALRIHSDSHFGKCLRLLFLSHFLIRCLAAEKVFENFLVEIVFVAFKLNICVSVFVCVFLYLFLFFINFKFSFASLFGTVELS